MIECPGSMHPLLPFSFVCGAFVLGATAFFGGPKGQLKSQIEKCATGTRHRDLFVAPAYVPANVSNSLDVIPSASSLAPVSSTWSPSTSTCATPPLVVKMDITMPFCDG